MGGTQIGARLSREMASVPGGKPAHGAPVPYPPKTVALCRSHHENTEDHLRACRAQGSTESIRLNLQKPFVLECVTAVGLTEAGGGLKTASIPGKMDSSQLHGPAASRGFRLCSLTPFHALGGGGRPGSSCRVGGRFGSAPPPVRLPQTGPAQCLCPPPRSWQARLCGPSGRPESSPPTDGPQLGPRHSVGLQESHLAARRCHHSDSRC